MFEIVVNITIMYHQFCFRSIYIYIATPFNGYSRKSSKNVHTIWIFYSKLSGPDLTFFPEK